MTETTATRWPGVPVDSVRVHYWCDHAAACERARIIAWMRLHLNWDADELADAIERCAHEVEEGADV